VKLHGTNSSIVKNPQTGEIWCQSREQIITPEKDNSGFATFISKVPGRGIDTYFNIAAAVYGMTEIKPGDLIGIYGEWCGQGIMKGVAISQIPKRFVVFGIKVYTSGATTEDCQDGGTTKWFNPAQLKTVQDKYEWEINSTLGIVYTGYTGIHSIQQFQSWNVEIDFASPELVQNYLVELTDGVEKECPVGKAFGVSGVGEGIVWRCVTAHDTIKTSDLIFKVKGEKHSDTKVKTTASVDIEKVNSIKQFAENVVTDHRCEKMIEKLKEQGLDVDVKNTGVFLKLVGADVLKEESDVIDVSGLERKDVMPAVNVLARQYFMKLINGAPL
jgi:hypothetical protein